VCRDELSALLERLEATLQQLIRRMHVKMDVCMTHGITGSQFFLMKRIHEQGRMTVSEVAGEMDVSLSAITAVVDKLHNAGLAKRERDQNDRRLVWLTITTLGEEVLQACVASRREAMKKYLQKLPEEDLEQLVRICEKLLAIMKHDVSPA